MQTSALATAVCALALLFAAQGAVADDYTCAAWGYHDTASTTVASGCAELSCDYATPDDTDADGLLEGCGGKGTCASANNSYCEVCTYPHTGPNCENCAIEGITSDGCRHAVATETSSGCGIKMLYAGSNTTAVFRGTAAEENFGETVSMSSDARYMFVGAPGTDDANIAGDTGKWGNGVIHEYRRKVDGSYSYIGPLTFPSGTNTSRRRIGHAGDFLIDSTIPDADGGIPIVNEWETGLGQGSMTTSWDGNVVIAIFTRRVLKGTVYPCEVWIATRDLSSTAESMRPFVKLTNLPDGYDLKTVATHANELTDRFGDELIHSRYAFVNYDTGNSSPDPGMVLLDVSINAATGAIANTTRDCTWTKHGIPSGHATLKAMNTSSVASVSCTQNGEWCTLVYNGQTGLGYMYAIPTSMETRATRVKAFVTTGVIGDGGIAADLASAATTDPNDTGYFWGYSSVSVEIDTPTNYNPLGDKHGFWVLASAVGVKDTSENREKLPIWAVFVNINSVVHALEGVIGTNNPYVETGLPLTAQKAQDKTPGVLAGPFYDSANTAHMVYYSFGINSALYGQRTGLLAISCSSATTLPSIQKIDPSTVNFAPQAYVEDLEGAAGIKGGAPFNVAESYKPNHGLSLAVSTWAPMTGYSYPVIAVGSPRAYTADLTKAQAGNVVVMQRSKAHTADCLQNADECAVARTCDRTTGWASTGNARGRCVAQTVECTCQHPWWPSDLQYNDCNKFFGYPADSSLIVDLADLTAYDCATGYVHADTTDTSKAYCTRVLGYHADPLRQRAHFRSKGEEIAIGVVVALFVSFAGPITMIAMKSTQAAKSLI